MRDLSEEHARLLLEDYALDLAEVPADILRRVVADWRHSQKWFPSVAELLAACEPELIRRKRYLARLEHLENLPLVAPEPEVDPEQEERQRAEIEAYLARMKAKKAAWLAPDGPDKATHSK